MPFEKGDEEFLASIVQEENVCRTIVLWIYFHSRELQLSLY